MTNTWTSYNQPLTLSGFGSSSQFFYDQNHQRWKQLASYSGASENTIYIGGLLEKMTNSSGTAYRHYVPAANNSVVYARWSTGSNFIYYMTQDTLGSTAVLTDQTGALVVKEKFAAIGYNENNGTEQAAIAAVSRHEYTGQEELNNLFMVNMNGRVYDGNSVFLSPDPYIPNPTNTQDYDRYSYVDNNPLTFVDPTRVDDQSACVGDSGCANNGGTNALIMEVVVPGHQDPGPAAAPINLNDIPASRSTVGHPRRYRDKLECRVVWLRLRDQRRSLPAAS